MDPTLSRRIFVRRSLAFGGSTLVLSGCGSADAKAGAAAVMKALVGTASVTALPVATQTPIAAFKWKPLRIGAGGWLTSIDIAADGTKVVRTDTSGAYIWSDATAEWTQLLTTATMPAGEWGHNLAFQGVYEVSVSRSNSSRIYVLVNSAMFRSDNRGASFTKTSLTGLYTPPNDDFRYLGRKMVVDPRNPNIVVLGSSGDGVKITTDGGATSRICADVPKPKTASGVRIAFDPSSDVRSGATQRLFASSDGNGVYLSNDGGATFSLTPGSPTNVQHMVCDQQGFLWATDGLGQNNLRKFANGVWTAVSAQGVFKTIAVDPANAAHIVIGTMGGSIAQSFDRGATWTNAVAGQRVATDIPWLAWTNEGFMSSGEIFFDPSSSNKLYFSEGIGVWWTNPPADGGGYSWLSQSRGIEQLVTNELIAPPGGAPLYLAWDRPIFKVDNPDVYPQTHGPGNADSIVMGWSADYAPDDSKTIVALINWWNGDRSGISTDGGATWRQFGSLPAEITGGKIGGSIAAGSHTNFMILPSNNGTPWFTKDAGQTWRQSQVPGVPVTGETGWGWAYYFRRFTVAADRVAANTFYLYNYIGNAAGLYRSTDGGANFTRMFTGTIGTWTGFHAKLYAVPGKQGHLFFSAGDQTGNHPSAVPFMRSVDGGATWQAIPNLWEISAFGFGKAAPGQDYPAIYIAGYVNSTYSIWRSDDNAASWVDLGAIPLNNGDSVASVAGDMNTYGKVYIGFGGSGAAYGLIS